MTQAIIYKKEFNAGNVLPGGGGAYKPNRIGKRGCCYHPWPRETKGEGITRIQGSAPLRKAGSLEAYPEGLGDTEERGLLPEQRLEAHGEEEK